MADNPSQEAQRPEENQREIRDGNHVNGGGPASGFINAGKQQTTTVSQVPLPPFTKLANPGPLGLIGFAITTFVLGLYECGAGLVSEPNVLSLPVN